MKKKKTNQNVHKTSILSNFAKIGKELFKTFKYAGFGLFKIFDFLITNIMTILTYIGYAIFYVTQYVGKFTYKLGYLVYKYVLKEFYILLKAIFNGLFKVLRIVFYTVPLFIYDKVSKYLDLIIKKLKRSKEKSSNILKETPKKIEDYFVNKFNNMSVVKHYRNKKERELEVLLIDKTGKDAERSEEKQTYQYLARNHEGKLIKGYFAAQSKLDVHSYLLDAGYTVYEIKTNKWINFTHGESKLLEKKMKNKDLVFWLAQLATYLKAGIPLTDAVKILAEQDKRKKYKKTYDSIIYELSMGESFSEALRKQGPVFPPLLINLIKAAELVGDLESTLDDMSEYYNEREATKKQMISALTYPIVILIFATIVLVFLLVYIVPKFADIYLSLNAKMNPYTQFLLDLSAFLNSKGLWVLVFLISGVLVFRILYKKLKAFRLIIQFILMLYLLLVS